MKPREIWYKELYIFITNDGPEIGLHMSVSHKTRYPTWDELKEVRYKYLPDDRTFAILFPPSSEYVNMHPNCFHFWELPQGM